jgi:hypothetical protein
MANEFDVYLTGQADPIRVAVKYPDMIVAEREAPACGVPADPSLAPMALTAVWVWCALRRMGGLGVGTYHEFMAALDDLVTVKRPASLDGEVGELADPTAPAVPTASP